MNTVGVLKTRKVQLHRQELLLEIEMAQMNALITHVEANSTWNPWKRYKIRREAQRLQQEAQSLLAEYNQIYRGKLKD